MVSMLLVSTLQATESSTCNAKKVNFSIRMLVTDNRHTLSSQRIHPIFFEFQSYRLFFIIGRAYQNSLFRIIQLVEADQAYWVSAWKWNFISIKIVKGFYAAHAIQIHIQIVCNYNFKVLLTN
jgi:hypothetical protein